MQSRELPQQLRGQSTRDDKDWHKSMMAKFNQLNNQYNKVAEGENFAETDNDDKGIFLDNKLDFTQENVFEIINKAKEDIKIINDKNIELNKKLIEYENAKKEATAIIESIDKISTTYYQLSTKTQYLNIINKLEIKEQLLEPEIIINISNFKSSIDVKIDKLNHVIENNKKKIKSFKKLVSSCMYDEENEFKKNMCSVCVTRKINICLNPCGHTFCSKCIEKMNNKCSMCRGTFISKIKMFIVDEDNYNSSDSDTEDTNIASEELDGFTGFISFSGFTDVTDGW